MNIQEQKKALLSKTKQRLIENFEKVNKIKLNENSEILKMSEGSYEYDPANDPYLDYDYQEKDDDEPKYDDVDLDPDYEKGERIPKFNNPLNMKEDSGQESNSDDPTKEEMLSFLQQNLSSEFTEFDAEEAIYWFGYSYHGGQWSNLYSALSTSKYKPSPSMNDIPEDGVSKIMYDELVQQFGGNKENNDNVNI